MKLTSYRKPFSIFDAFLTDPFEAFSPLFDRPRYSRVDPTIEWFEDDSNYHVRLDLPGVSREELKLEFEPELLTLKVSKPSGENENGEAGYERHVRVPEGVEVDHAEAKLEDGVLTLTLPKVPERKPVRIEVE